MKQLFAPLLDFFREESYHTYLCTSTVKWTQKLESYLSFLESCRSKWNKSCSEYNLLLRKTLQSLLCISNESSQLASIFSISPKTSTFSACQPLFSSSSLDACFQFSEQDSPPFLFWRIWKTRSKCRLCLSDLGSFWAVLKLPLDKAYPIH